VVAAIAAGDQQGCKKENCPRFRHFTLHFL
jgi:hypothetical protein